MVAAVFGGVLPVAHVLEYLGIFERKLHSTLQKTVPSPMQLGILEQIKIPKDVSHNYSDYLQK